MKNFLIICRSIWSPQMVGALDACPGVDEWCQVWPGAIIAKATYSTTVETIDGHLHARHPQAHFMALEFEPNATAKGWMDKKVWDFIQESDAVAKPVNGVRILAPRNED